MVSLYSNRLTEASRYKSRGMIPESFLLGCGVPEQSITFVPSLNGAVEPFQYHSCFISYSTKDEEFARRLHSRLRDASEMALLRCGQQQRPGGRGARILHPRLLELERPRLIRTRLRPAPQGPPRSRGSERKLKIKVELSDVNGVYRLKKDERRG